jgi:hypothetical protein
MLLLVVCTVLIPLAAISVLLALGFVRLVTLLSGGAPPAQTPVGVVPPGQG